MGNESTIRNRKPTTDATVEPEPPNILSNTIEWDHVPEWAQDNAYIRTGYRRTQNAWKGCFYSIFGFLHNETINIHSHLWGAALFVYLAFNVSTHLEKHPTTWLDYAMFSTFLLSAVFCLLGSSMFHTSGCHSKEVAKSMQKVDYTGIVILIVGSFYPCLYYGFYCEPQLQFLYIGGITGFGLLAAYVVLSPTYGQPSYRGTRTTVFIALGLSAVFPTLHWVMLHGFSKLFLEMGFEWLLLSGALYIGGALLYANRIPERFAPGGFDHFGSSHQIFHCCVVLAALAHYASVLKSFDHSYSTRHPCRI